MVSDTLDEADAQARYVLPPLLDSPQVTERVDSVASGLTSSESGASANVLPEKARQNRNRSVENSFFFMKIISNLNFLSSCFYTTIVMQKYDIDILNEKSSF